MFLEQDSKLFLLINHWSGSWLDYVFGWTTFLGTPILFAFVLVFMLIWDPKGALKKFAIVLLAGAGGGILASSLKLLVHRQRPFNYFYDDVAKGKVVVNTLFNAYVSNSFPSSHTALAFAIIVALNYVYKNKLVFLYPLAFIVGVSRIYVGAHFPSDVLAGALAGCLGSLFVVRILGPTLRPDS